MNEVWSLRHELTEAQLFRLLWSLQRRRVWSLSLVEIPVLGVLVFVAYRSAVAAIVSCLAIPLLNFSLIWSRLKLASRSKNLAAARSERVYIFYEDRFEVKASSGQQSTIPYSTLYAVTPIKEGILLEIQKYHGYWLAPRHFPSEDDYRNVLEIIKAGRTAPGLR